MGICLFKYPARVLRTRLHVASLIVKLWYQSATVFAYFSGLKNHRLQEIHAWDNPEGRNNSNTQVAVHRLTRGSSGVLARTHYAVSR